MLEKIKNVFKKKPNYQQMYEQQKKFADHWEFKYNKVIRQLRQIMDENGESEK